MDLHEMIFPHYVLIIFSVSISRLAGVGLKILAKNNKLLQILNVASDGKAIICEKCQGGKQKKYYDGSDSEEAGIYII